MWSLLADIDWTHAVIGIGSGIGGGFLTFAGGLLVWFLKFRRQSESERNRRNKTTINELQDIIDQKNIEIDNLRKSYEQRISLLEARTGNLESRQWRFFSFYKDEHARSVMLYDNLALLHNVIEQANADRRASGLSVYNCPPLPERPTEDGRVEAEFLMTQSRQEAKGIEAVKNLSDAGVQS